MLKHISPNASEIESGTEEAKKQIGLMGGLLPVQSWDDVKIAKSEEVPDTVDETCTLCDVDDDM